MQWILVGPDSMLDRGGHSRHTMNNLISYVEPRSSLLREQLIKRRERFITSAQRSLYSLYPYQGSQYSSDIQLFRQYSYILMSEKNPWAGLVGRVQICSTELMSVSRKPIFRRYSTFSTIGLLIYILMSEKNPWTGLGDGPNHLHIEARRRKASWTNNNNNN